MKTIIQKLKKHLEDAPLRKFRPEGRPTGFVTNKEYEAKKLGILFPKHYVLEMTTETTDIVDRCGEEVTGITTYCSGYMLCKDQDEADSTIAAIEQSMFDDASNDPSLYH